MAGGRRIEFQGWVRVRWRFVAMMDDVVVLDVDDDEVFGENVAAQAAD